MKVEQVKPDYTPVTITLESQEECDTLRRIMEEVIRITSAPLAPISSFPKPRAIREQPYLRIGRPAEVR